MIGRILAPLALTVFLYTVCHAQTEIVTIASPDRSCRVYVAADAGEWEKKAAEDLATYLGQMTGADVRATTEPHSKSESFPIFVGTRALLRSFKLQRLLSEATDPQPIIRSDAIAILVNQEEMLLAGSNDDSHYFSAVEVLRRLGCRWYLPTEFGEFVPKVNSAKLASFEYSYSPPFEVRSFWIGFRGDTRDHECFSRRNFFNLLAPGNNGAHNLGNLLADGPTGKALSGPEVAQHIVSAVREKFKNNQDFSLGMNDETHGARNPEDRIHSGGFRDKYFSAPVSTDIFISLYNRVATQLLDEFPNSQSKIGFLAYSNATLPPQRVKTLAKPLICFLAPIDIDPFHSFKDPLSPGKQDFKAVLSEWAKISQGRVVIYDYDQAMLLWRDLPTPNHRVFQEDIREYQKNGILGFMTETRGAGATTFLNIHFRGQLQWNPNLEVQAELDRFYLNFFGEAHQPMRRYWTALFEAWENTSIQEHEYFSIPSIYTPDLVENLGRHLAEALHAEYRLTPKEKAHLKFVELSYSLTQKTFEMIDAVASHCDFAKASNFGNEALEFRKSLKLLSPILVNEHAGIEIGEAWWPGEVGSYEAYAKQLEGQVIQKTPLKWHFKLDSHDHGLWRNWTSEKADSSWMELPTNLYLQAQGIRDEQGHDYTGFAWYKTSVELTEGDWTLHFPGLFGEAWLYQNGILIEHRDQHELWWHNDYGFNWRVPLGTISSPSNHDFTLRIRLGPHYSGLFRRPFLTKYGQSSIRASRLQVKGSSSANWNDETRKVYRNIYSRPLGGQIEE